MWIEATQDSNDSLQNRGYTVDTRAEYFFYIESFTRDIYYASF